MPHYTRFHSLFHLLRTARRVPVTGSGHCLKTYLTRQTRQITVPYLSYIISAKSTISGLSLLFLLEEHATSLLDPCTQFLLVTILYESSKLLQHVRRAISADLSRWLYTFLPPSPRSGLLQRSEALPYCDFTYRSSNSPTLRPRCGGSFARCPRLSSCSASSSQYRWHSMSAAEPVVLPFLSP